jgi:hypothetical protein
MTKWIALAFLAASFCFSPLSRAADPAALDASPQVPTPSTPVNEPEPTRMDRYYERVSDKFDFGAANFMMGWTELVSESADYYQKKPGLWHRTGNTFIGLGRGLVIGTVDVFGGLGNAATALFPQFQIPLPQGGVDIKRITG